MAKSEGVNVANAYVTILPSITGAEKNISDAITPAVESASSEAGDKGGASILNAITGALGGLGEKFASIGGEVGTALWSGIQSVTEAVGPAAIAAAAVTATVAVGSALEQVGAQFDDMSDAITIATGASGGELSGLEDIAKSVATTVPVSFEEAGSTVAAFSQRMGDAGGSLQDLATKASALGEMTGQAVDVESLASAFNMFSISGQQASDEMDYLFGVSQNTGIGFNELTSAIQTNAPAMTQMGFSFEETANMAGLLEKSGMNANSMMSKMSKGLVNLAQPGESAKDAFSRVTGEIQGYIASGDQASALDLASQIFGTRGAAQFVAAVQSGAMSLDALGDSALGASGDIMATEEATEDWPELLGKLQNSIILALEPLGSATFSAVGTAIEGITAAFDTLWQTSEPLRDTISGLADGAFAKLEPILEPLSASMGDLGSSIVPVLSGVFSVLSGVLQTIGTVLGVVFDALSPVLAVLAGGLSAAIEVISMGFTALGGVLEAIGGAFSTVAEVVTGAWSGMGDFFGGIVNGIIGWFSGLPGQIQGFLAGIPGFFSNVFSGLGSYAQGAIDDIGGVIQGLPGKVWDWISSIPQKFADMFSSIHVPTFHIEGSFNLDPAHFSVPHLAFYAAGGFIDQPTAIVGEAGGEFVWPSYQPYIGRYAQALASAMDAEGSGEGAVVAWLDSHLGPTIERYAPTATPREFARQVRAYA